MDFTRLLCPEDVQRFQDFVRKQVPTITGVLHVNLVDSMINRVPVRLFHTCTVGHDGHLNHMVGINEENREGDVFPCVGQQSLPAFSQVLPGASEKSGQSAQSEDDLSVLLRTSLQLQVLGESVKSCLTFSFGADSNLTFLRRFKEWKPLQTALELMHAEVACGTLPEPHRFSEVTVMNPVTQTEFKGSLQISALPRELPLGDEAAGVELAGPEESTADFELVFLQHCPVTAGAGNASRRRQRKEGSVRADSEPQLPGQIRE